MSLVRLFCWTAWRHFVSGTIHHTRSALACRDACEASLVSQIASSPRQTQITHGVEVTSPLPSNHRLANPAVPSDNGAADPVTDAALLQTAVCFLFILDCNREP